MLRFIDGFDYYVTADLTKKWSTLYSDGLGNTPTIVTPGRYGSGTKAMYFGSFAGQGASKTFENQVTWIVGFAFKWTATGANNLGGLVNFLNSTGGNFYSQGYITFNGGVLAYTNGNRANYSQSSAITLAAGVWNYIEFKTTASSSCAAHSTVVKINGNVAIDVPAGTNTMGNIFGDPNIAQIRFGSPGVTVSGLSIMFDDVYICDGTGSINNDFLGDVRVEAILPSAAGNTTGMSVVGASTNWQAVSEASEDGDTSYVYTSTVGTYDTYTLADLTGTAASVLGIQVNLFARKDDAGARFIAPMIRTNATDYVSSKTYGVADGYSHTSDVWELNPNGNVAWTPSVINTLEAGVKLVS